MYLSLEHGLSVGPRYDPESLFFNRKCICDEDWAGELCNTPIADQVLFLYYIWLLKPKDLTDLVQRTRSVFRFKK
jgi:hypothetical protein